MAHPFAWLILSATFIHSSVAADYHVSDTVYPTKASAEAYCLTLNTQLASIHTVSELADARSVCGTKPTEDSSGCWIGLTKSATDPKVTWSWTDGTTCDFGCIEDGTATTGEEPWAPLQPYANDDCVHMDQMNSYLFNDLPCGHSSNYALCNGKCNDVSAETLRHHVVWAFWFGQPMAGARLKAYKQLNKSLNVHLVTQDNLKQYDLSHSPMHPAVYEDHLSSVHKADYLRAYFMRHYGGGYHDIKPTTKSWDKSFAILNENKDVWMVGVAEPSRWAIACDERYAKEAGVGPCDNVRDDWQRLGSNCAYIMRPYTPLVNDWFLAVHARLDEKYEVLQRHPAPYSRCCLQWKKVRTPEEKAYPFAWAELHGCAFHPFQLKYINHVKLGLPKWNAGPYRSLNEDQPNRDKT
eukprot:79575_1